MPSVAISAKAEIITYVVQAQKALNDGHSAAVKANSLAFDIACIQDLQRLSKELGLVMQAISKLRGL